MEKTKTIIIIALVLLCGFLTWKVCNTKTCDEPKTKKSKGTSVKSIVDHCRANDNFPKVVNQEISKICAKEYQDNFYNINGIPFDGSNHAVFISKKTINYLFGQYPTHNGILVYYAMTGSDPDDLNMVITSTKADDDDYLPLIHVDPPQQMFFKAVHRGFCPMICEGLDIL